MNRDMCRTCKHWQVFPENNLAGRCPLLGIILWPKVKEGEELLRPATDDDRALLRAELSLTVSDAFEVLAGQPPTSEVIAVRTQHDFGCVRHEAT